MRLQSCCNSGKSDGISCSRPGAHVVAVVCSRNAGSVLVCRLCKVHCVACTCSLPTNQEGNQKLSGALAQAPT